MLLFVISALRAVVEMLGLCLIGQGMLYLLAGSGRRQNAIYRFFDLLTRPPRQAAALLLPRGTPGMLVGPDGLPAEPNRIVSEEWLRVRPDANTLPPEGSVKNPTITDSEYPLRISWEGVLVDDPGFNGDRPHRDDIVRRVRKVFDLL